MGMIPARAFRRLRLAVSLLAAAVGVSGCSDLSLLVLLHSNRGTPAVRRGDAGATIPYRVERGVVVLAGRVEGREARFVLDTGAPFIALLPGPRIAPLRLETRSSSYLDQRGKARRPSGHKVGGLALEIGPVELQDQTVLLLDPAALRTEADIDGIVGYDLFRRYVVEVRPRESVLLLHDPEGYRYDGKAAPIPLEFSWQVPQVQAGWQAGAEAEIAPLLLQVDLGKAGELDLDPRSHPLLKAPSTGPERTAQGANVSVTYRLGAPGTLRMGDVVLRDVTPAFPVSGEDAGRRSRNGKIGAGTLLRFERIVFDYPRSRLYLETSSAAR